MEPDTVAVRVDNFTKVYDQRTAVDRLSFDVQRGEILGLVGPNGSGKTTTLRCISGILPPTSGSVLILGHDVVKDPIAAKRNLAIVADDPNLFESLTVWEHLEFSAQVFGLQDWQARAEGLLEEFEITDRRQSLADELSRGMRQKVAICAAFLHEPAVLLLDEPLTGLDPHAIRNLYAALERQAKEGTAVIVSSHLLGQISSLCSRFLIIKNGRALQAGTIDEIRSQLDALPDDASLEDIFFHATDVGDETDAS